MYQDAATVAVATAFIVALMALGMGGAFLAGRRGGLPTSQEPPRNNPQISPLLLQELQRCLEMSDYMSHDSDALLAAIGNQSSTVDLSAATAAEKLVKHTKNLSDKLHQVAGDIGVPQQARDPSPAPSRTDQPQPDSPATTYAPAPLDPSDIKAAQPDRKPQRLPGSPFDDARQFRRSSFNGSAKATIYPRHPGPGREPISCTVLTRDLSCGGIGIAHSDQLFPKQIVVLDAVGKLLVGEIRWCRRVDEKFYVAGCRLVKANQ